MSLCAILTALIFAFGRQRFRQLSACSTARTCGPAGRSGVWSPMHWCIRRRRCFGSRSRCICCSFSAAKWNAFIGQRAYIGFVSGLAARARVVLTCWGLWMRTGHWPVRPALAFRDFRRLCDNLSAGRVVPAHYGEMVRADSRCHLHPAAAGLNAWAILVVLWTSIGAAFLFVELRGAGPELGLVAKFQIERRGRNRSFTSCKNRHRVAWSSRMTSMLRSIRFSTRSRNPASAV